MDLIMWGGILVFLFLCNQLPKLQYFKITQIYHLTGQKPHRFLQVRSPVTVQVDCLLRRVSQFSSQCISRAAFYLMLGVLFQAHANYWQNSVTCGCRTEVPFSCMTLLLAQVIQLLESTLRHWLHSPLQRVGLLPEGQKEPLSPVCCDGVLDGITYSWEGLCHHIHGSCPHS